MKKMTPWVFCLIVAVLAAAGAAPAAQGGGTSTPSELVSAYDSLADTILSAKMAEWHMVHSILATTYSHAMATLRDAKSAISQGKDSKAALEKLADLVSQLGNEGDAAVAAIRKRLVEGGHHHNASGEQKGIYDEGFVIVTREAKKVFLDAAGKIARSAASPEAGVLEAEWKRVSDQYKALSESH